LENLVQDMMIFLLKNIIKQLLFGKITQTLWKTSKLDFFKMISRHFSNYSRHTYLPRHTVWWPLNQSIKTVLKFYRRFLETKKYHHFFFFFWELNKLAPFHQKQSRRKWVANYQGSWGDRHCTFCNK
jgi:hypothetical protein